MNEYRCACGFAAMSMSINGILRAEQDHADQGCEEPTNDQ